MPFVVIEDPATQCVKISKLRRHIIMFELVFHKKQIAQRARVGPDRIEEDRSGRARDRQESLRRFRTGKIMKMLKQMKDEHYGNYGDVGADGKEILLLCTIF